jgi:hypothetical protein
MTSKRVAVLGAGLQGACVALELARRSVTVDLYERNPTCLAEASTHNEGKIHLGFVYAGDKTLKTARLMATGALCFQPLLRRWVGDVIDRIPVSSPFHYVVHRDGLIDPDAFATHVDRVTEFVRGIAAGDAVEYFGQDPTRSPQLLPSSACIGLYDPARVAAVFQTSEISFDPEPLASIFRQRLAETPEIRMLLGRKAVSVSQGNSELVVHSVDAEDEHSEAYDHVVNASWSGRLQLDTSMGIAPQEKWTFRFKYFVRTAVPRGQPPVSATIVLGPFGDIASYTNGVAYLSWYPTGLVARSNDVEPPELPATLAGPAGDALAAAIASGLGSVVPSAPSFGEGSGSAPVVKGGWIFAWGVTDIDNSASRFHQRCDVGVHANGRYLSIDTGKLTLAPLFAVEAADRVTGKPA